MAYFIAAYITKQRFTVLTKNGGGDHKRRLSRVHYICTMHCVQCTLEKQCTAHHVIMLFSESKSGVQKLLNGLQNLCQRWQMTVNLNKTKLCIFDDKYSINDNSGEILFNNKPIEICKEYHYLGITFSTSKNRFKTNSQRNEIKHWMLYSLRKKPFAKLWGSQQSLHLQLKFFDTQIQPIFNYGSEIWYTGKQVDEF